MNDERLRDKETKRGPDHDEWQDNQVPLDRLIREGRWEELKNNGEYRERGIKDRIRLAKRAVTVSLGHSDAMYWDVLKTDPADAQLVLDREIKPLKNLITALNKRYIGELQPKDSPREMTEVLKIPAENKGNT